MQRPAFLLSTALLFLCLPLFSYGSEIVVKQGQGLRSIAAEHLGDPDLWPEILRSSGLSSPGEVKPGMRLTLPGDEIAQVSKTLAQTQKLISDATEKGARLFAAQSISRATDLQQQAMKLRKKSAWFASLDVAKKAVTAAEKALAETESMRDAAAQAILNDRTGTVQSRKTRDLAWNSLKQQAVLLEREKVRTLSNSSGEILFVDNSRLRLSANSQAQIQSMRVDKLTNAKKISVTLTGGDVHALLGASGRGKSMKIKVPGLSVDSKSSNFWVGRKKSTTKFANYDDKEMQVTSSGETVVLKKNQGTVVNKMQAPTKAVDLLLPPGRLVPVNEASVYEQSVTLQWQPVKDAVQYRIEVALTPTFGKMLRSIPAVNGSEFTLKKLDHGAYYWRVSAINKLGLPGPFGGTSRFWIKQDDKPPQIIVRSPQPGAITRKPEVIVSGSVERHESFTINGTTVSTTDGSFSHKLNLSEGINEILLTSRDKAGNESRQVRKIRYMPDKGEGITYRPDLIEIADRHFATRDQALILGGITQPGARIEIMEQSGKQAAVALSDDQGRFGVKLAVSEEPQSYTVKVKAVSGQSFSETVTVSRDLLPPEIRLDANPPPITTKSALELRGQVINGNNLYLNDESADLRNNAFTIKVDLVEGANPLILSATDAVGNETRLLRNTTLDSTAPKLIKAVVSPPKAKAGDTVRISVQAKDATGLKPVATVTTRTGSRSQTLRLQLDKTTSSYGGVLHIPTGAGGKVRILDVTLEDQVGNRKKYTP